MARVILLLWFKTARIKRNFTPLALALFKPLQHAPEIIYQTYQFVNKLTLLTLSQNVTSSNLTNQF